MMVAATCSSVKMMYSYTVPHRNHTLPSLPQRIATLSMTHCLKEPRGRPSLRGIRPCLNPLRIEDVKKTTSSHLFTLQLLLLPTDTPRRTLTRMPLKHNQAYLHWPYCSPSFVTTP